MRPSLPAFTDFAARPALHKSVTMGLLAAIAGLFVVRTAMPAADNLTHGFLAYYVGAQTIADAEPGVRLYDEAWFADRVAALTEGRVRDIFLANPPAMAVLWLPLAALPVETARSIWTWLNVLFLSIAIGLIANELLSGQLTLAVVALAALFTLSAPVREQFRLGQMYAFLLWLHVIGWRAYAHRHDRWAGFALGLALVVKLSGWPIGLLMVAQRRWRAVGWTILTILAVAAITLPFTGLEAWREALFVEVPAVLARPEAAVPAYQTTAGFWQHLFRYDPTFNPNPVAHLPMLAIILSLATAIAACSVLITRTLSDRRLFAAAVALTELLSPAAEQYHYVLLLLPLAVLWHEAWTHRSGRLLLAALAAAFLIAWPLQYNDPASAAGWRALLYYPRLYGGWLMFVALIVQARREPLDGSPRRVL